MKSILSIAVLSAFIAYPSPARADGSLEAARELYASAAYDDALTMLNGLTATTTVLEERQAVDLYRTLCLVALGRTSDADHAIEEMIVRDPMYRAAADELSPRLRSAFADARKRVLPAIIQKQYADAKDAFDRQNFQAAAEGFSGVLKGIANPDISALANVPPLSDLRTLAGGFYDLSMKSIAPPEPAPAPKAVRVLRSLYTANDPEVRAPAAVEQKVPKYPGNVLRPSNGVVEFIVDERGAVISAVMQDPIEPQYDSMVISAVKKWRFEPATVDGTPVKFLKRLSIAVTPSAR